MTSRAHRTFEDQLTLVGQLVNIHAKLQKGKGRRHQQNALHHAGVAMTVAAWESYVERIVMEAMDAVAPLSVVTTPTPPVPPWAKQVFALRRAEVATLVRKFHAPNAGNARDLMRAALEFDPCICWTWLVGPRQWDQNEMRRRLDQWVQIRHSVAHGFSLPADISWLKGPEGKPRLTLRLLCECKRFFEHVVTQTDRGFADHLVNHLKMPAPW